MFEQIGWFLVGALVGGVGMFVALKFIRRNNPDIEL